MRVLLLHVEFPTPEASKHWAYFSSFGLGDAFRSTGCHVNELIISHYPRMCELILEMGPYDLIVINDIVHGFGLYSHILTRDSLKRLRERSKLLVGVVGESVYSYKEISGRMPDFVKKRIQQMGQYLDLFDGFWLVDERDHNKPGFNIKPYHTYQIFIPRQFQDLEYHSIIRHNKYMVLAHLNEIRRAFLGSVRSDSLLSVKLGDEDERYWRPYHEILEKADLVVRIDSYNINLMRLKRLRFNAYVNYLNAVSSFRGLLHMPTFWTGVHPRFLDAGIVSRVPIMPPPVGGYGTETLRAWVDYIPYEPEKPESLNQALETLNDDLYRESVASEASKTVRNHFSAERVIGSFLEKVKGWLN